MMFDAAKVIWYVCQTRVSCLPLRNASVSCISRVSHGNQKGQASFLVDGESALFAWLEFPHSSKEKQSWGKRNVCLLPLEGTCTSPSLLP